MTGQTGGSIGGTLWWVLTRLCNLACSYCYQGSDHALTRVRALGLEPWMPREVLGAALPWALTWPDRGPLRVVLYGGEPTLAWETIEWAVPAWEEAFARAGRPLRLAITTNGTRLAAAGRRDFLDRHRVGMLLSLDGPRRLHERTRVRSDGRGSWDEIDPPSLLAWRPELEVAWQLDPSQDFEPADLDELVGMGFRRVNFNLNWLVEWPEPQQLRLQRFFKHLGRRLARNELESNWRDKYVTAGTVDARMPQPCGTGLRMLALTPEGWLYPSQEMAFTVFEPGRARGTPEHYRVGDVRRDPVVDAATVARVSQIRTEQIKPPPPFDCSDCVAASASIGGCHCRYVGQDGRDPANRYSTPPGYCQSMRAAMTGLIQGFWIERRLRPAEWRGAAPAEQSRPAAFVPLDAVGVAPGGRGKVSLLPSAVTVRVERG